MVLEATATGFLECLSHLVRRWRRAVVLGNFPGFGLLLLERWRDELELLEWPSPDFVIDTEVSHQSKLTRSIAS